MFTKNLVLPLLLAAALAPSARASSEIEIAFGKRTGHGGIFINLSSGHGRYERDCEPRRTWVPAHFETREEQVWVDGCERQVWAAPVYDWRYDNCGRPYRVQLEVGHWKTVCTPGHFECRKAQVWVCGRWEERRD
jgi:hypothetical protein